MPRNWLGEGRFGHDLKLAAACRNLFCFYASAHKRRRRRYAFGWAEMLSVRPSVNTYFVCRDIFLLIGEISMKLGINIRQVSGNCRIGFIVRGQRSKVKVTTRPIL